MKPEHRITSSKARIVIPCAECGHTEDPETARERWAFNVVTQLWTCDECFADG